MMKRLLSVLILLSLGKLLLSQNNLALSGKQPSKQNKITKKPSLIPLPQKVRWKDGHFSLAGCKAILITDSSLLKEAAYLKQVFLEKGIRMQVTYSSGKNEPVIELRIAVVAAPQITEEAYGLTARENRVLITANSSHGINNGIQTLVQLMQEGKRIANCEITDWPAFSWRGYMVDVGRNYQSIQQIKQQVNVMAAYKLNVFHFHFTEDIAWRLAIKQYPQLTAPANMLRNKGQFYSESEMKDLIAYCKERYITLVPEIDMPGHSQAFKRAFKNDMQTDSGMAILKNILREICTTYELPYLHIGADEVTITNKDFIPEMTAYIESLGKKIIGWEPGGNFTANTIRQMWMDDNGKKMDDAGIQYIDSRHLYLNHMDPLEAVVTIFNRKIAGKEKGDQSALGGTICMWHDRAVTREEDILTMNPVYPSILAFAERSWRGGGYAGWTAMIGESNSSGANEFREFENRLLDHREHYFSNLPFPYLRQSTITWKLFGPYENEGKLSAVFAPELKAFYENKATVSMQANGGTIVLRHWWFPLIRGWVKEPKENTTWYATTRIWSAEAGYKAFWIGFNNLCRSPATDSPPVGAWDDKQSAVWINGKLIEPPNWKQGGQKGNSEIPLIDEGYEYRSPASVLLKKGWNTVLIKTPVGSFKGKDWQNPVKWMFTFIPVSDKLIKE